ncbi:MAG: hypothetical protein MUC50_17300, partial [Myxococcota bacterium]|nr:hypothetical protein [Myxococcota bacterium]
MKRIFLIPLALALLAQVGTVEAAPLTLFEIDEMSASLDCRANCEAGVPSHLSQCLTACGPFNPLWEKNGVLPIDGTDLDLALLEMWDAGTLSQICYQDGWVVPIAACGSDDCLATHTAAECADADGDGLKEWKEETSGTSDAIANELCANDASCGFNATCVFFASIGERRCLPRPCATTGCTAFHLELVESDNSEVIARIHFDYSPMPTRVLDLYLEHDNKTLSLTDARPLEALVQASKELQASYTSNGMLRLIVLSPSSMQPIPYGPIIELVFSRTSGAQTKLGFSRNDTAQSMSLAPSSEDMQQALADDGLWGDDLQISARDPGGDRLLLYYAFDRQPEILAYDDVKDAVELCEIFGDCKNLRDEIPFERMTKLKMLARLETLQRGATKVSQPVPGVRGDAAFFDGNDDHLELPLLVEDPSAGMAYRNADRSYTFTSWFYAEGDTLDSGPVSQILFNHQNFAETTRYGVGLRRGETAEMFELVWFWGDAELSSPSTQTIASGLSVLDWHHLAMTVDDPSNTIRFFVNGEPMPLAVAFADDELFTCPGYETGAGTGVVLHEEGKDVSGGRSPEAVLYAATQNNLYGIDRMDPNGFGWQEVLREGTGQAMDPDFSPITGKIVYASSKNGDFDIWIANEDGSNPRAITRGFGDTARGIFARRPKWAPNASAIVFESNIYSIDYDHNWYGRTYQLYTIAYDTKENEVAIPLPSGETASALDYDFLGSSQIIDDYALTSGPQNSYGAVWLAPPSADDNGTIAFTAASDDYDVKELRRGAIPSSPSNPKNFVAVDAAMGQTGASTELLDGRREGLDDHFIISNEWVAYDPSNQFTLSNLMSKGSGVVIRLNSAPSGYSLDCWDLNGNGVPDLSLEDTNKDGATNLADCYPAAVNIYIGYDAAKATPRLGACSGTAALVGPGGLGKKIDFSDTPTGYGNFLKVTIKSPFSSKPIPEGLVATIVFDKVNGAASSLADYSIFTRNLHQKLADFSASAGTGIELVGHGLAEVTQARFSPDGQRILLAGLEGARPTLTTLEGWKTAKPVARKVAMGSLRVEGMDWSKTERFYPCQWIGGTKNPKSKIIKKALRGALDETRLYSYVRSDGAISSEYERGKAWLDKSGQRPKAQSRSCAIDSDCAPFELCDPVSHVCALLPCKPDEANPCPVGRGECTLLPVPVGGIDSLAWVCSTECAMDRECFEQECKNGSCRFCDIPTPTNRGTNTCLECRNRPVEVSGLEPWMEIEGCPDRNSFSCEDGSCQTECYSMENGQSRYLCDPAIEFCQKGRCVGFEWQWNDISPMTMSGLGQMQMMVENAWTTVALSQSYPVEINAYGVEDYLHSPQIIVEGRVSGSGTGMPAPYGDTWFEIGVVSVHNRSQTEAMQNPYTVSSPYPMTEVRLRLISPPLENANQGNHGLLNGEKDFCAEWNTDRNECVYRATGSRATIGYRVGIPLNESRKACYDHGGTECNYQPNDKLARYLWGGQPAAVVLGISVADTAVFSSMTENKVCGYAATQGATDYAKPTENDAERKELE